MRLKTGYRVRVNGGKGLVGIKEDHHEIKT